MAELPKSEHEEVMWLLNSIEGHIADDTDVMRAAAKYFETDNTTSAAVGIILVRERVEKLKSIMLANPSAEYHLLENGDVMQGADEALDDNCQTWWRLDSHDSGKLMIGQKYSKSLLVPMRRPGKRPPNAIEKLVNPS